MFVDFVCIVLNVLFYVPGVMSVVVYERRSMIGKRSVNGGYEAWSLVVWFS